jgi:hypothetical protein
MRTALIALVFLASPSAFAQLQQTSDNVAWESALGRVEYVYEDGRFGVFEYPLEYGDNIGRLYIDGLAGEFGGNGPLDGYWSEPDVSHDDEVGDTLICPFAIIDGHGRTTNNWGRVRLMFTDVDFPSDFVLMRGRCFEDANDVIPGKRVN